MVQRALSCLPIHEHTLSDFFVSYSADLLRFRRVENVPGGAECVRAALSAQRGARGLHGQRGLGVDLVVGLVGGRDGLLAVPEVALALWPGVAHDKADLEVAQSFGMIMI